MKISIDTLHLRELVYNMLRNLDNGVYDGSSNVCAGMLDSKQTEALDDLISKIERLAE